MKSYVTMERCIICQGDTGAILLDRRLRDTFEMYTTTPHSVCDSCRAKYLKSGVMLVCPDTGGLVVLRLSAYKRIFNVPVPKGRIAYCEAQVIDRLQANQ